MGRRIGAKLRLQNGIELEGWSFGYNKPCDGNVIFSTAMTGYPESLTDPSNFGQILCLTYPLIGNIGVPDEGLTREGISKNLESERIWARGLVVSDYSENYSHWSAVKSLDRWMKEQRIPGIYGIDTRRLTKILRNGGSTLGIIVPEGGVKEFPVPDPDTFNQAALVSCKEPVVYGNGEKTVLVADCGVKHSTLRYFLAKGLRVVRVPWNCDFNKMEYDGLYISEGPGHPRSCGPVIKHIAEAFNGDKPIFGVGMGNQLMAKAGGASVYKLKYGHHGHNQPVRMVGTKKCLITTQNYDFAVDESSIGEDWNPWFVNMNDGTCEGIRHKTKPFCSVQFYPDLSTELSETAFLFDQFISKL